MLCNVSVQHYLCVIYKQIHKSGMHAQKCLETSTLSNRKALKAFRLGGSRSDLQLIRRSWQRGHKWIEGGQEMERSLRFVCLFVFN